MQDVVYLLLLLAVFVVLGLFVVACDRIIGSPRSTSSTWRASTTSSSTSPGSPSERPCPMPLSGPPTRSSSWT